MLDNMRSTDIVARAGGDEFLILAIECHESGASGVVERLQGALARQGVLASLGCGVRKPQGSLREACLAADEAM